jgi:hypothetical protein
MMTTTVETMKIDRDAIEEYEVHKFSVEASDLGWSPGQWPAMVTCIGLGNNLPLIAQRKETRDGDLLWVDYRQSLGCCQLRVYND